MKQTTKSKTLIFILLIMQIPTFVSLNDNAFSLSVTNLSVSQTNNCVDKWIIICGDRSDHNQWNKLLESTEFVYDTLISCGMSEDDIYYLVSDVAQSHTSKADAVTSHANITYAIRTWATWDGMDEDSVLGIYIASHGGYDGVAIYPDPTFSDGDLAADLVSFHTTTGCTRYFIIVDTCHAGSFTDPLGGYNRIVVTSTLPDKGAYFSAIPPHRLQFTDAFFYSLSWGNSIADALAHATWDIKNLGYSGKQFPNLDDNEDEIGHTVNSWGVLPNGGDGYDAMNAYICGDCSLVIDYFPFFMKVPLKTWYEFNATKITVPISVEVANQTNINTCFVRAVPTNWFPPDPIDEYSIGDIDPAEDTYRHSLIYNSIDDTYDGTIILWSPLEMDYNLTFVVEDVDGKRGPILKSQIGINSDGVAPPDITAPTVYIKNVNDGDKVSEEISIEVIGNDEESGLKELSLEINGETVETMPMPDYLPYPALSFELDPYEYKRAEVLKITGKAKDNAGASSFFEVFVEIDIPINWLNVTLIAGGSVVVVAVASVVGIKIVKKKRD